jgi:DNA-binding CsgD family transcriptional regulator
MATITQQLIFNQIPGCIAWKDINLRYQAANTDLLLQMNLKHAEELIGRDDADLALHPQKIITAFQQQDLMVLQGQSIELIHHLDNLKDSKAYFLKKTPLRDEQLHVIGVIFHCMPYIQADLVNALKNIDHNLYDAVNVPDCYMLDTCHNPANLSARELECLFLQLRGHSAKRIGETLGLSKRTIESYIDNIKTKLGCLNKSELLVTAMMQGYHRNLPKSLLKLNLLEVLKP